MLGGGSGSAAQLRCSFSGRRHLWGRIDSEALGVNLLKTDIRQARCGVSKGVQAPMVQTRIELSLRL